MSKVEIVRGMPATQYHSLRAASSSRLKAILRSPAHLKHMDENGLTADALALGEAVHTAVLEPHRFKDDYGVAPRVDKRTKEGKAAWQMFVDANPTATIINEDDWLQITGMARAIQLHPSAMDLVNGRTETEVSLFWNELGMRCKARLDGYNLDSRCLIDIKTTQDASRDGFSKSIANFGYHIQAAWYIDAARAAGFDVEGMVFVAVEKTAPYGVGVYLIDDASVDEGRRQLARALPLLANCEATNTWPSYDDSVQTISLPRWAVRGEEMSL
jgi:hypothetical protein